MSQFLSHAHIECIINGHQVTGWADEDPPYSFPVESSKEFQVGADGALYGISKPMFGGAFHFMVQPSSPTAQWAMVQEQIRKDVQLGLLARAHLHNDLGGPGAGPLVPVRGGRH